MHLLTLPFEILVKIFKTLSINDIKSLMLCCRTLRNLILNDDTIWKVICQNRIYVCNNRDSRQSISCSWYNRYRISYNWCKGVYRNKRPLRFNENYMPWLKYHNSEFLVLSIGSELRCYSNSYGFPDWTNTFWKIDVPQVYRHDKRTNDISRFTVKDKYIVCGNRDGCVAVYSTHSITREPRLICKIMDCHENGAVEVSDVDIACTGSKTIIVTCSLDSADLCYWNLEDSHHLDTDQLVVYKPIHNCLLSGQDGIKCLAINNSNDKVALGLVGHKNPLLLDMNTRMLQRSPEDLKLRSLTIRDIRWHDNNSFVYVTHSGHVVLMDARTMEITHSAYEPFRSSLYCVRTDGHNTLLVGTSEHSRCVMYDRRRLPWHLQLFFTQSRMRSPVYCLDFDSRKLIAAADRGIGVLDFNIKYCSATPKDYSKQRFEVIN